MKKALGKEVMQNFDHRWRYRSADTPEIEGPVLQTVSFLKEVGGRARRERLLVKKKNWIKNIGCFFFRRVFSSLVSVLFVQLPFYLS